MLSDRPGTGTSEISKVRSSPSAPSVLTPRRSVKPLFSALARAASSRVEAAMAPPAAVRQATKSSSGS